ncbi:protein kinase family protein [Maridesulfovibrio sp.]|uniref:protein kinase family protein n=1 Tax=Maridesulfovibrio sp. TaxID=2795000 RepID=UPI0029F48794|nr:protein kinase family protein [Maridesulfovibrio sp.]
MNPKHGDLIKFIRRKDYEFIKELGQGGCGKTVLLRDPTIDEDFVCKKYAPRVDDLKDDLFPNFVREIKIMHKLYHRNVVRVFNYHLYPIEKTGYILMERIYGDDIDSYIKDHPDSLSDLFVQAIEAFAYLEKNGVLHRDIRPQNILVSNNGTLKVIDFGFGKIANDKQDFDKSISINWWCEPPEDFEYDSYSHCTEVYFLGKLFEKIIHDYDIDSFRYLSLLRDMNTKSPDERIDSFSTIKTKILTTSIDEVDFTKAELSSYRMFSDLLYLHMVRLGANAKYHDDVVDVIAKLESAYRNFMLEVLVPNASVVTNCFIDGDYSFRTNGMKVADVKVFINMFKSVTSEKQRIILANLHTRLDSVFRDKQSAGLEDVPF